MLTFENLHFGIDIGGTLIKLVIVTTVNNAKQMKINRDKNRDVVTEKFVLMFKEYPSDDYMTFIQDFKDNFLPYYSKPFIYVTGGGAVKHRNQLEKEFGLEVRKEDEMASIFDGMSQTLDLNANIIYNVTLEGEKTYITEEFEYPLMVANIGSGISIIQFDKDGGFKRVGGTALGGATFVGLCNKLIGEDSFKDQLEQSKIGDDKKLDLRLSDFSNKQVLVKPVTSSKNKTSKIGYNNFERQTSYLDKLSKNDTETAKGPSDDITFCSLGMISSLTEESLQNLKKEDIARSMLHLITYNVSTISFLYSQLYNVDKIQFTGTFINNQIVTQKVILRGIEFFKQNCGHDVNVYFSEQDGYFGALACIKKSQVNSVLSKDKYPYGEEDLDY